MNPIPALSIIVPFYDEAPSVDPVIAEIARCHPEAEIIAVDDGSSDGTLSALRRQPGVRVHHLKQHLGQSAAVYAGLKLARADVCVIMDGDGQSNAAEIKRLLPFLPEYDLVIGRRVHRQDPGVRILASRVANAIRRTALGDSVSDAGGTPKVMKRALVEQLVLFDGLHRFLPAWVQDAGFRVIEVPVDHRPRHRGRSKYGTLARALRGAIDLLGVRWLRSRRIDPRALELGAPEQQANDATAPADDTRPQA